MTIQNANEARELSERNKWSLEKILVTIEEAASAGEHSVIISGELSSEMQNQLTMRGFLHVPRMGDTHIHW